MNNNEIYILINQSSSDSYVVGYLNDYDEICRLRDFIVSEPESLDKLGLPNPWKNRTKDDFIIVAVPLLSGKILDEFDTQHSDLLFKNTFYFPPKTNISISEIVLDDEALADIKQLTTHEIDREIINDL